MSHTIEELNHFINFLVKKHLMTSETTGTFTYNGPTQQPIDTGLPATKSDKIRPIAIRQLDRGYIVEVGCQSLAIESATELITYLSTYILQPAETENLYYQGKLFK